MERVNSPGAILSRDNVILLLVTARQRAGRDKAGAGKEIACKLQSGGRRRREGGPGAPRGRGGRAEGRQGAPCPRVAPEGGSGLWDSGIQEFKVSGLRGFKVHRFKASGLWASPAASAAALGTAQKWDTGVPYVGYGCLTVLGPALVTSDPGGGLWGLERFGFGGALGV